MDLLASLYTRIRRVSLSRFYIGYMALQGVLKVINKSDNTVLGSYISTSLGRHR